MAPSVNSPVTATAKSLQLCLTLCDPTDGSPPGSPVPGILQARTLVWVAISFSNAWKWKVKAKSLSRVRLLVTPWIAAHQAPLSMGWYTQFSSVQSSRSVMSHSLQHHGLQHARLPCPTPTLGACSNSCLSSLSFDWQQMLYKSFHVLVIKIN